MNRNTDNDYTLEARRALKEFLELPGIWRNGALTTLSDLIEEQLRAVRVEYAAMLQIQGQKFSEANSFEKQRLDMWTKISEIWTPIVLFLYGCSKD